MLAAGDVPEPEGPLPAPELAGAGAPPEPGAPPELPEPEP